MKSMEDLRQDVIDAARKTLKHSLGRAYLKKAVDALDEAEKSDPLQLLRECHRVVGNVEGGKLEEALSSAQLDPSNGGFNWWFDMKKKIERLESQ